MGSSKNSWWGWIPICQFSVLDRETGRKEVRPAEKQGYRNRGGGSAAPWILAYQLTLFKPGGQIILAPTGFSDLPTALKQKNWPELGSCWLLSSSFRPPSPFSVATLHSGNLGLGNLGNWLIQSQKLAIMNLWCCSLLRLGKSDLFLWCHLRSTYQINSSFQL